MASSSDNEGNFPFDVRGDLPTPQALITATNTANSELAFQTWQPLATSFFVRKLEDGRRVEFKNMGKRYSQLVDLLDSDEDLRLYRRFGYLHARILSHKQDELNELEEQLNDQNRENFVGMHQKAAGQRRNRIILLSLIEQKLSEYNDFLSIPQTFLVSTSSSRGSLQSITEWLCGGPDIGKLNQENDPRWRSYSADVKCLLLSTQNNYWLDYNISDILSIEEQGESDFVPRIASERRRPRLLKTAMDVLGKLRDAVFLPFSVLVYAVNIASALGYLMLVNTPVSQQSASPEAYWKVSLIAWAATIAILLLHGLFFGNYTTECYARRIVLLSIAFCSVIAFALHMLAANVTSGVLVGFTLSVTFIQIW